MAFDPKEFSEWLEKRGKPSAARLYFFASRNFLNFLKDRKYNLKNLSPEILLEFLNTFSNPYSRNAHHACLKSLFLFFKSRAQSPEESFYWDKLIAEVDAIKYSSASRPMAQVVGGKLKLRKIALSEEGVAKLFQKLMKRCYDKSDSSKFLSYVACLTGTVLTFYFGWRPVEATVNFMKALEEGKVDRKERIMVIQGAKTHKDRILTWHESIDVHLDWWEFFAKRKRKNKNPFLYSTIITRNLYRITVEGVNVTAKTGRETVVTHLRKRFMKEIGMDERYILPDIRQKLVEWWVGHTTTPIQDVYTDEGEFLSDLKVLACKTHYLPEILQKVRPEKVYEIV